MDYINHQTPGAAFEQALRNGYQLRRLPEEDNILLLGCFAFETAHPDRGFLLHRVGTHYEWVRYVVETAPLPKTGRGHDNEPVPAWVPT